MKATARIIDRRRFLGRLGLGASAGVLAPLFPLTDFEAEAAGGYPLRFVVFWNGTGNCDIGAWRPAGGETGFTLSDVLSPLEPFKDRLVIIEGLHNKVADTGAISAHRGQLSTALTGTRSSGGGGVPGSMSLDQRIAEVIRGNAPFGSLPFTAAGVYGANATLSARGPGQAVPGESNPQVSLARIFPSTFAPATGATPTDPQKAARDMAVRRQRLLDVVVGDTTRARNLVGAEGQHKIDRYRAELEAVAKRANTISAPPPGGSACARPTVSLSGAPRRDDYVLVGQLNMSLASAALACDRTRVVVLQWGTPSGGGLVPEAGTANVSEAPNSYHRVGHNSPSAPIKRALQKFYSKQLAVFLASLEAVKEGPGTLLDNTLVFWSGGMTYGNHTFGAPGVPYVLVPGKNINLRAGRYLKYNGNDHSQLLASLGCAMGADFGGFALLPGLL